MKIIADLHTHTIASVHAYSTLKENTEQALSAGLSYLGVSDHAPGMPNTTCESYFYNLKVIRGNVKGIQLLKGAEANIMDRGGRIDLSDEVAERLDYVIASLHDLVLRDMGIAGNTQAVIRAMTNPYIRVIGHPDDDSFPLDYRTLAVMAKFTGVALELNNSSLSPHSPRSGCHKNARKMLSECARVGANIIVGSDSHIWYDVGGFRDALLFLKQFGFPPELVVNSSQACFGEFISGEPEQVQVPAAV